jgi:2,4-dienoyl-CoA reductase-like NADH-dependent reductase (Old Yellow Enzyme family)
MSKLFTPYNLSGLALKNRVVMAPMTRTRTMNDVPDEVVALYYAQRASAGLLITEGMPVSEEGRGYLYTPGIYNDEHVQGWRKVTQAVHAKGGRIFAQLWHVGRMSHVSLQPGHIAPVSAGTVQAVNTTVFALTESGEPGPVVPSQPRALETHEVKRITADFVHSARLAMEAGFDGVEIMAANGFIFDQFLSSELNTRTDEYGGSLDNRMRFMRMCLEEVMNAAAATGTSVLVKHNMYDGFKGGIEIPESIEIAREIERWKVNGIVLSGGFVSKAPMAVMRGLIPIYTMSYYSPLWLRAFIRYCGPFMIRQFPFSECYFLEDAKKFREALQLPLIYVGGLVSREGIERALDSGFELVQMARALVNDPAFVNKLREGDAATRSECDHRNYCIARMYSVDMKCCKHCGDLPRKIREELAKLP